MKKRIMSSLIVAVLILSMILGTTSAYAESATTKTINNLNVTVTGEDSFILDGVEYTAVRMVVEGATEAVLIDEFGTITEHIRLDFEEGVVTDIKRNQIQNLVAAPNMSIYSLNERWNDDGSPDDEGFMYLYDYVWEVGTVANAASLVLSLYGIGVPMPDGWDLIDEALSLYATSIYAWVSVWRKTDTEWQYIRNKSDLYMDENCVNYLAGTFKTLQKRPIDY